MALNRKASVALLVVAAATTAGSPPAVSNVPNAAHGVRQSSNRDTSYGTLPLAFEPLPQISSDGPVYVSRGAGFSVSVSSRETALAFSKPPHEPGDADVVRIRFAGMASASTLEAIDQLPGRVNYLIGDDPATWRTGVPTFAAVRAPGCSRVSTICSMALPASSSTTSSFRRAPIRV